MARVILRNIAKRFGKTEVLQDVSLTIEDEEMMVIVGPSGCGKSTLLRIIAGFETPTSGDVIIGDAEVTEREPSERGIAMVFQSYALYPHMTVAQNIGFCLRNQRVPKQEIVRRVQQVADSLQIGPLLERLPAELSGGQRQRVAIGRAIVRNPEVFLFDEPLSNLDALLRVQTRIEIARLHQLHRKTMIYVTHDQIEAMTLASRIAVLNKGSLEQVGKPLELYDSPKNLFVAGFLGSPSMGFVKGELVSANEKYALVRLAGGLSARVLRDARQFPSGTALTLGVRPERLRLSAEPGGLPVVVNVVERLGSHTIFHCLFDSGTSLIAEQEFDNSQIRPGDRMHVVLPEDATHVFAPDGTALSRSGQ